MNYSWLYVHYQPDEKLFRSSRKKDLQLLHCLSLCPRQRNPKTAPLADDGLATDIAFYFGQQALTNG